MRLDKFLQLNSPHSLRQCRQHILSGHVRVDDGICLQVASMVNTFSKIELNQHCLQNQHAYYLLLNKPKAVECSTRTTKYPTVIDLIQQPFARELHIAGRLDVNTTGLVLLTNDGNWSKSITRPEKKVPKTYLVRTEKPMHLGYADVFAQGLYLAKEALSTLPAKFKLLNSTECELTIYEGKHHQIKRMFAHFDNKVLSLHRFRIGELVLHDQLPMGQYRHLLQDEVAALIGAD